MIGLRRKRSLAAKLSVEMLPRSQVLETGFV
jgi:hypothetical protein